MVSFQPSTNEYILLYRLAHVSSSSVSLAYKLYTKAYHWMETTTTTAKPHTLNLLITFLSSAESSPWQSSET